MSTNTFIKTTAPVILSLVNTVSLISATITFGVILALAFFRRQSLDRVTIRFQGIIALIDIARHIVINNLKQSSVPICKFFAFFSSFLDHIYVFINVLITLNMQLIYIQNILPKPVLEIFYILGAIILAFVIDIIPFAYDAYGKNHSGYCYLTEPNPNRVYFKILLKYATITPGLFYIIVVFVWVVVSLFQRRNYIEQKFPAKDIVLFGETINGRDFIKKLYFRMSLYPISSVVSFFPYILSNSYFDIYGFDIPDWLFFIFRICARLTGFMNLVSLIIDPHFHLAAKNIYKHGLSSNQHQTFDMSLNDLGKLKREDEEYLVEFPGEESIRFEDYIKFL